MNRRLADLRSRIERRVSAAEARDALERPIPAAERDDVLSQVRWFTTRYATGAERLAYIRQAYDRWTAFAGIAMPEPPGRARNRE